MSARFEFNGKPSKASRKKGGPKGFIMINCPAREIDELRALADCEGIELRLFIAFALHRAKAEAERLLGITANQAVKIPREIRRVRGLRRWRAINALRQSGYPVRN